MDSQKNNNQTEKGCDVMDSPKNTALKTHNQNIAEKPLIDKMEKEFFDINQQIERIAQAVKAGTMSIEEAQKAYEIIEEKVARLQAEQDGLKKRVKENEAELKLDNERILTLGKTVDAIMETNDIIMDADEIKALFNNTKLFYNRLAEIEERIDNRFTKIEERLEERPEHLVALTKTITNLREYIVGSSESQQEDNGKSFMYLYILFGLTIAAVGADIVTRLIRG